MAYGTRGMCFMYFCLLDNLVHVVFVGYYKSGYTSLDDDYIVRGRQSLAQVTVTICIHPYMHVTVLPCVLILFMK